MVPASSGAVTSQNGVSTPVSSGAPPLPPILVAIQPGLQALTSMPSWSQRSPSSRATITWPSLDCP